MEPGNDAPPGGAVRAVGHRGRGGRGGRGGFRGGRGRGGRNSHSHTHKRHAPRGGNKRAREERNEPTTQTEDERERRRQAEAYFGVPSSTAEADAEQQPTALPVPRRDAHGKTISAFATLRSLLVDAASLSEYVLEHRTKIKKGSFFNDAKATNMFFQAISNLPDTSIYAAFMSTYKSEVLAILERMFSLYSVGKTPLTPSAHEFLIRCEQNGVRSTEWSADGVKPLVEGEEPSLLTARELIKRLATLDPVARLQRQIELSADTEDVAKCVRRFAALQAAVDEDSENADEATAKRLDYACRCQVISKIVSKTRRLLTSGKAPAAARRAEAVGTSDTHHPSEEAERKQEEPAADAAAIIPLTEEQTTAVREGIAHAVLEMLLKALDMRPPGSLSSPITKVIHFAEWGLPHNFVSREDHDAILALKDRTNEDLEQQAAQLETVMKLKEVAPDDDEGLRSITDALWADGEERFLSPSSVDVLSALAVAASPESISDDVKRLVSERLIATQQHFSQHGSPIHMPRRAMRFLNEMRNKERDAAIAKMKDGGEDATARPIG